jgi:hypothetical protein
MKSKEEIESIIAHLFLIIGIVLFLSIPFLIWAF